MLLSADMGIEKTQRDFHSLRKGCWYFSHRWLIAGSFAHA